MNFNTENFKSWKKKDLKAGELAEYIAYQDSDKNRIVIFQSADELVRHFEHNCKAYGGNGSWSTENIDDTRNGRDTWRYGNDFDTYEKTREALSTGKTAMKYLSRVEKTKDELYNRFPKLYELEQIAIAKK